MVWCLFVLPGLAEAGSLSCAKRAYDNGIYSKAEKLFKQMAQEGDPSAQYYLGLMFGAGKGVPQNYVLAHMWSNIAATTTRNRELQQSSASYRDSIEMKMTIQQIEKAQEVTITCTSSKFKDCNYP